MLPLVLECQQHYGASGTGNCTYINHASCFSSVYVFFKSKSKVGLGRELGESHHVAARGDSARALLPRFLPCFPPALTPPSPPRASIFLFLFSILKG